MGLISSKLTPEEKAAEDAKHAQVSVMKESLLQKVEEHEERLHNMKQEGDPHLAVFKDEMMAVVDEHIKEHATMEAEMAQLATFKTELMDKVHEHMNELHRAEDKAAAVAKFKDEMNAKVDAHAKAVAIAKE